MDKNQSPYLPLPKNCIIKSENKHNIINFATGEADISSVNRCVPLLVKNTVTLYQIGNTVKMIFQPAVIAEGVHTQEVHEYNVQSGWKDNTDDEKNTLNKEAKRTSLSRTKRIINELVACNDWRYFITITLSPEKWDRYNTTEELKKSFSNEAKRWRRKNKAGVAKVPDYKYLIIPELHEDGAIHLHGFVNDVPVNMLEPYTLTEINGDMPIPVKICEMVKEGENVYHCSEWDNKYGYNSLTKLKDADKAANYVTKYVTKSFENPAFKVKYWCSRGLNRATLLGKYYISDDYKGYYLGKIHTMSVTTKKGNKMYYETDTSIINTDNPTVTNAILAITAFINNSDYSTKEIVNFTRMIAENEIIYINKPKE